MRRQDTPFRAESHHTVLLLMSVAHFHTPTMLSHPRTCTPGAHPRTRHHKHTLL